MVPTPTPCTALEALSDLSREDVSTRTCSESSLSRRPASCPVPVCLVPSRCVHRPCLSYCVTASRSHLLQSRGLQPSPFSLPGSLPLRVSVLFPGSLCLGLCSPSLCLPLLSPGSAFHSGSPCSLCPGLPVLFLFSLPWSPCSLCRDPCVLSLWASFCQGLSVPPPSPRLPPWVSACCLSLVSWCLCTPLLDPLPHFSGMLPLWFFHPWEGEGQALLPISIPSALGP